MFRCVLIITLCLSALIPASIGQLCTGFRGGSLSDQALKQEYASSVFTVGEMGTAYLVDSRGYLVTANHVLNDLAEAKKPLEVWVAVPDSRSHKVFSFVIIKRDVDSDIALLKIQDPVPEAIQNLRPLDISSIVPDLDTTLFVMGYPVYGHQGEVFLRSGDAKFNSLTPAGMMEVEQLTEGGNSGGPLLNNNGYVVGTCEQQSEQNKIGRYLPIARTLSLFDDIPVSERMLNLEDRLVRKTLDENDLKQLLAHSSASPTNLEFYLWAKRVTASSSLTALVRPHLRCPIIPALLERGILEALYLFYTEAENSQRAQISLALGDREYRLGHDSTALQYAKNASALVTNSREDIETKIGSLLLQGKAEERMNLVAKARKSYLDAFELAKSPAGGIADVHGSASPSLWAQAAAAEAGAAAKSGRDDEAYRYFAQAEDLYKDLGDRQGQYDTNLGIARLKLQQGDYYMAERFTQQAIAVAPDDQRAAYAWYQLGAMLLTTGNGPKAVDSYRHVIALAPKSQFAADVQKLIAAQDTEKGQPPIVLPPPRPPR